MKSPNKIPTTTEEELHCDDLAQDNGELNERRKKKESDLKIEKLNLSINIEQQSLSFKIEQQKLSFKSKQKSLRCLIFAPVAITNVQHLILKESFIDVIEKPASFISPD